ncbi:hypothetical protein J3A83DRAFT_4194297 [Scleroderma citrinum]
MSQRLFIIETTEKCVKGWVLDEWEWYHLAKDKVVLAMCLFLIECMNGPEQHSSHYPDRFQAMTKVQLLQMTILYEYDTKLLILALKARAALISHKSESVHQMAGKHARRNKKYARRGEGCKQLHRAAGISSTGVGGSTGLNVHYTQTRDIESQTFKMEVQPSVPPFILPSSDTVMGFIISFCISIVVWCPQLGVWYLQCIVGYLFDYFDYSNCFDF